MIGVIGNLYFLSKCPGAAYQHLSAARAGCCSVSAWVLTPTLACMHSSLLLVAVKDNH